MGVLAQGSLANLRASSAGATSCSRNITSRTLLLRQLEQHALSRPAAILSSSGRCQQRCVQAAATVAAEERATMQAGPEPTPLVWGNDDSKLPRVIIAGGGIGGLVLAVALLKKGFPVQVLERDLTAIRGEGKYRGPIQIQSNALAALEAIDAEMAERIMAGGCITGDRVNGLCDGLTGDWYCKFDTFHPAVEKGLPVTRVISRVLLQQELGETAKRYGGPNVICNNCHVVGYEEATDAATGQPKVTAVLEDGRRVTGDVLIGADGIWSKIRKRLLGPTEPCYSQYTCYTGIADFTPPDIDTVGYRVFLGNGKYFVSSDVGGGKMQWYGFHKEAAGGSDPPGMQKKRLLEIFGSWNDAVTDLIKSTPEEDVLRRDIYDRPPILQWTKGRVALLGDSAHAMQPNLGQGGCMAIEDGYQLGVELLTAVDEAKGGPVNLQAALQSYQAKRVLRASTIHGLAGMAAIMASTYKAYLGEGLGPLSWLQKYKIPHPGRVGGKVAMDITMPTMLSWVLGGNVGAFKKADRVASCRITDKPRGFDEQDFGTFMTDNDALLRAAQADWMLVPSGVDYVDCQSAEPQPSAVLIPDARPLTVGRAGDCALVLDHPSVSDRHAVLEKRSCGNYWVTPTAANGAMWVNEVQLKHDVAFQLHPGDEVHFGTASGESGTQWRVKMYHVSLRLERSYSADSVDGAASEVTASYADHNQERVAVAGVAHNATASQEHHHH